MTSTQHPQPPAPTASAHPPSGVPLRHRMGAVCLVVGTAVLLASAFLDPEVDGDGAGAVVRAAGADPLRWTAWSLGLVVAGLLLLPAVVALGAAASGRGGRGVRLAAVGAVMTAAGAVGVFALGLSELTPLALAGAGAPGPAELAAAEALESSVGVLVTFALLLLGWYVGRPLLLWGLWRAGAVHLWVPVTGTAAAVGGWLASGWPDPWEGVFAVVGAAALLGCLPALVPLSAPARRRRASR